MPTGVAAYSRADTLSASEYESGSCGGERENGTNGHVACFHRRGNGQEYLHSLQTITLSSQLMLLMNIYKFISNTSGVIITLAFSVLWISPESPSVTNTLR